MKFSGICVSKKKQAAIVPAKAGGTGDFRCALEALRPRFREDDGAVSTYTLRVATAGGTREARSAGPSTASCPSSHKHTKPTGT